MASMLELSRSPIPSTISGRTDARPPEHEPERSEEEDVHHEIWHANTTATQAKQPHARRASLGRRQGRGRDYQERKGQSERVDAALGDATGGDGQWSGP